MRKQRHPEVNSQGPCRPEPSMVGALHSAEENHVMWLSQEQKTVPGHVGTQEHGRTGHSGAEVSPCFSPAENRWSD